MDYTENLSLLKPEKAEQYNLEHWNNNSDIIDSAFTTETNERKSADSDLQEQINTNRNVTQLLGTIQISQGGTGKTTAQSALNALHKSVVTASTIESKDEITFIQRTKANVSTGTSESIDVKDIMMSDLANKVLELIRAESSSVFSSTLNGFAPKSSSSSSSSYLNAEGKWTVPALSEEKYTISNAQELNPNTYTIYTTSVSENTSLILNGGASLGQTVTFCNPSKYKITVTLAFFGGNKTMYIPSKTLLKLWWDGSEWNNFALSSYEIGSLYWSSRDTNPANLFGGTWTQIKDKFVLAAGDTYSVNATGGASTVTLTTAQLPSHNHTLSHTHTFSATHGHKLLVYTGLKQSISNVYGGSILGSNVATSDSHAYCSVPYYGGTINSTYVQSTTITGTTSDASTTTTSSSGSGNAFSIMNPYVVKYCWERTA